MRRIEAKPGVTWPNDDGSVHSTDCEGCAFSSRPCSFHKEAAKRAGGAP